MTWQLAVIANVLVAVAYAGIAYHIGSHLTRTHQWRANALAALVATFFTSCAMSHLLFAGRIASIPALRGEWQWHMVVVDLVTAAFGGIYFLERMRHPKLTRGAALFEDTAIRRSDAMEIQDNVVQGLVVARYALDRGDGRAAAASIDAAMVSARRVIDELLPPGSRLPVQGAQR